jgi:hypothetical protein
MARRILIAAYHLPPALTGGTQRPVKLAKHLQQRGWDARLLGPAKYPGWLAVDAKQGLPCPKTEVPSIFLPPKDPSLYGTGANVWFRRALQYLAFPDVYMGWSLRVIANLGRILRETQPDVIVTTSPPMSVHLIGLAAKRRYQVRWVADFRDPWVGDAQIVWRTQTRVRRPFMMRLERAVVRQADLVTTAFDSITNDLAERAQRADIVTVTNGYDLEDWQGIVPRVCEPFTIVYTGSLAWGGRNLTGLFRALEILEYQEPGKYKFLLVGPDAREHVRAAHALGLTNVQDGGVLARRQTLELQAGAGALLLIGASKNLPGKLFEYLVAQRPILASVPEHTDAWYILNKWSLARLIDFEKAEETAQVIRDTAAAAPPEPMTLPYEYDWRFLAQKFEDALLHIA